MQSPELLRALQAAEGLDGGKSWEEVRDALQALAGRPNADQGIRIDIANRIAIAATSRFRLSEAQVLDVLDDLADDIALMPPATRAGLFVAASVGRPSVAGRYLDAVIAELEALDEPDAEALYWLNAARERRRSRLT